MSMTYEVRKGWTQREWLVVERRKIGQGPFIVCRTYNESDANLIAEALNELAKGGSAEGARTGAADGEAKS